MHRDAPGEAQPQRRDERERGEAVGDGSRSHRTREPKPVCGRGSRPEGQDVISEAAAVPVAPSRPAVARPARPAAPGTARGRPRSAPPGRGCAGPGASGRRHARGRAGPRRRQRRRPRARRDRGGCRRARRGPAARAPRPAAPPRPPRRSARSGRAAAARRRVVARTPEQPLARARRERLDVLGRDVQQRDLGVGGQEGGGLGDRRLPGVLDDPDERAHAQISTCALHHRSTSPPRGPRGTVSAPRRTNSPSSTLWSSTCRTRRHSSVASEPT